MSPNDQNNSSLPMVVAVTGHRDLVPEEMDGIRRRVADLLTRLKNEYPERTISVMSSLAEGADRVVARVALELGIRIVVPLPMSREFYEEDFTTSESLQEFDELCSSADEIFELPLVRGLSVDDIRTSDAERSKQYAQLGVFLCAHCHILLALWDGKPGTELGGTGQVVRFHHDDIMPGYTSKSVTSQQTLVDDESDLVYHVVCSRDRSDGGPLKGLNPVDAFWFTKDRDNPRSESMPDQHRTIFERSAEFSRDTARFGDQIERESYPLYRDGQEHQLPPGVDDINRLFCSADWLAIHYQGRTLRTLRLGHVLAFLMGLMFILFADLDAEPWYMYAFLAFFVFAALLQARAKKRAWHRKYLDYRTLAEGLRVQFYWAVAGATNENESKFAHDNFLQSQDPELGWIRNVMRVAGTRIDASPNRDLSGLNFVLREWIGDRDNGQLGFFRKKSADRIRKNRLTERLGTASLLTSVSVVLVLVFASDLLPAGLADPLKVLMGTMLLLFGIRQGYAYATAEKELIKQYDFMLRIFYNARRRLDNTDDPDEQRQILLALGGSALDEHAEWILMHRDRSIDESEIWRMSN